jgi:hypothetical protein
MFVYFVCAVDFELSDLSFAALVLRFSYQVRLERVARSGFLLRGVFLSTSTSPISHLVLVRVLSDQASSATLTLGVESLFCSVDSRAHE